MPTYAPDLVVVPSANGLGIAVNIVNATILRRKRIPQPFLNYLNQVTLSDNVFPDGYVGQSYLFQQTFSGSVDSVSIIAGALPPGLSLTIGPPNQTQFIGTPTTIGSYDFTTRYSAGGITADYLNHITILVAPDEGAGGVGGG